MELNTIIEKNDLDEFQKWKSNKTRTVLSIERPLSWCVKFNRPRMVHLLSELLHKPITQETVIGIGVDRASDDLQLAIAECFPDAMKSSKNPLIRDYLLGTDKENIYLLCKGYTRESTERVKNIVPRLLTSDREMFVNAALTNYETFIHLMQTSSNPPLRLFDDVCDKDIDERVFDYLLQTTGRCIDSGHILRLLKKDDIERMKTFIECKSDSGEIKSSDPNMKEAFKILIREDSFIILLWILERINLDSETRKELISECCINSSYGCIRLLLKQKDSYVSIKDFINVIKLNDLKMIEVISEVNGLENILDVLNEIKCYPEIQKIIHFDNICEIRSMDFSKLEPSDYSNIVKIVNVAKTKKLTYKSLDSNTLPNEVSRKSDDVYEHLREYGEIDIKITMDCYLGLLKYMHTWYNAIDLEKNLMYGDLSKTINKDLLCFGRILDNVEI